MHIVSIILCPLTTKMHADLGSSLVSFTKYFIVGLKHVDLEVPVFTPLSSKVDGESNIEQVIAVIIVIPSTLCFNKNVLKTSFDTNYALLCLLWTN